MRKHLLASLLPALLLACCQASAPAPAAPTSPAPPSETQARDICEVLPDPGYPVDVSVRPIPGYWGVSLWHEETERFEIVLSPDLPPPMVMDVFLHEWAHVMVWDAVQESPHDALWGVALARCYRLVMGEEPGFEEPEEDSGGCLGR